MEISMILSGFYQEQNKANLLVLGDALCVWIPACAGMTKKNISVYRCKSVSKKTQFEKTKPICRKVCRLKLLFERKLWLYHRQRDAKKQSQSKPTSVSPQHCCGFENGLKTALETAVSMIKSHIYRIGF